MKVLLMCKNLQRIYKTCYTCNVEITTKIINHLTQRMDWEGFEPPAPSILAAVAKEVRFRAALPALKIALFADL